MLTVDDHGPGIPPAARDQVFQRFQRGADSPGTGLGLTLVAQQVALHGGTVRVTDRPDGRRAPGSRWASRWSTPAAGHPPTAAPPRLADRFAGPRSAAEGAGGGAGRHVRARPQGNHKKPL